MPFEGLQAGVDGFVVSNHGGRIMDTVMPAIEALPEVVDAVGAASRCFSMAAYVAARM